MTESLKNGLTYAQAGVDISAGNALVEKIKPLARETSRSGADTGLGGFGGAFDLKAAGYNDPILISGTDGVGTKLRIAIDCGQLDSIGIDLVAMCVNDILAQGAEPLFFLDYLACASLNPDEAIKIIGGVAKGCQLANCALIGGESAEMPGMYADKDFDLAGFSVGAVERGALLPKEDSMKAGDAIIALGSSGPHSNGYSMIRKVVEQSGLDWSALSPFDNGSTLSQSLLTPTRIYVRALLPQIRKGVIKGLAHITGGGLIENPPRMMPEQLVAALDYSTWELPPVFDWLQSSAGISTHELRRTFNCGIGMLAVVDAENADGIIQDLSSAGEIAWQVGELTDHPS